MKCPKFPCTASNIKVAVNKCNSRCKPSNTYETIRLKPNFCCKINSLTQDMLCKENAKYVIEYDFSLLGQTITVPKNCILEFDGGTLSNGTIIGQDTYINDVGGLGVDTLFGESLTRKGTWRMNEGGGSTPITIDSELSDTSTNPVQNKVIKDALDNKQDALNSGQNIKTINGESILGGGNIQIEGGGSSEQVQSDWNESNPQSKAFIKNKPTIPSGGGDEDKPYDPDAHSGLGRKTLELGKDGNNILTQEDFDRENTIYVIKYDFDLDGAEIQIPKGCVLQFEGGSISNGRLISNKTYLESITDINNDALHGIYYTKDGYLNYNQKKAGKWNIKFESGYITPGTLLDFAFDTQSIAITHDYVICLGFESGKAWNEQYAIFIMFDRDYNYIGSCKGAVSHCNDCTVYQDKLYVACSGTESMYSQVHVYNLQDIIAACIANPDIRHSNIYDTSVSPVEQITTDTVFYSIDYDPVTDEFGIVLPDGVPAIYDTTLTVRKKMGSKSIETYLYNLLGTGVGNQSCVYKKGVMTFVAWYHKFNSYEYGVLLMINYDFKTDEFVDYQTVQSPYSYAEPEGAFKDPDDDNTIYCGQLLSSDQGYLGFAIGKVNQTENVITVSDKTEKTCSVYNYNRTRRVHVGASYEGKSDGGDDYPWKRLDEAIVMTQGFAGNIEFVLKPSRKTYYIPYSYTIDDNNNRNVYGFKLENGKRITIRMLRYSGEKPADWHCYVEGAIISYGGILELIDLEVIPIKDRNIHIGRSGFILAQNCEFFGTNDNKVYSDLINAVDGSKVFVENCVLNGGNTAVRLSNSYLRCYNTEFNSCQVGINAELNSTIETVVSTDDIRFTNVSKGIVKGDRNKVTYNTNINKLTDLTKFLAWAKTAEFDNTAIGFYVSSFITVDTDYVLRRGEYVYSDGFVFNSGTGYPICNNNDLTPLWYRTIGTLAQRPDLSSYAAVPAFENFEYTDKDTSLTYHFVNGIWKVNDYISSIKTLSVGDSILRGWRNGNNSFFKYITTDFKQDALSNTSFNNVTSNNDASHPDIPKQLVDEVSYSPDIIITGTAVNDWLFGGVLGNLPTEAVTDDEHAALLDRGKVYDAIQYTFYQMIKKYPTAQRFFVTAEKFDCYITEQLNGNYNTQNTQGYSYKDLLEGIKKICELYNVVYIDIFNNSLLNTMFAYYKAPTRYDDVPVGQRDVWNNTYYCDLDGLHPTDLGYKEAYAPIIREAIRIGTNKR